MPEIIFRESALHAFFAMDADAAREVRDLLDLIRAVGVPDAAIADPDVPEAWSLTGVLVTVHWMLIPEDKALVVWVRYNRLDDI